MSTRTILRRAAYFCETRPHSKGAFMENRDSYFRTPRNMTACCPAGAIAAAVHSDDEEMASFSILYTCHSAKCRAYIRAIAKLANFLLSNHDFLTGVGPIDVIANWADNDKTTRKQMVQMLRKAARS